MPDFSRQYDFSRFFRFLSWWRSELISVWQIFGHTSFNSAPPLQFRYSPKVGFNNLSLDEKHQKADPLSACTKRQIEVLLTDDCIFRLEMSFPVSSRRQIRAIVDYCLIQESPLSSKHFYFDCAVKPSVSLIESLRRKTVTAAIVIAHKSDVDNVIRQLEANGASSIKVGCANSSQSKSKDLVFKRSSGGTQAQKNIRINRVLSVSALALVILLPLFIQIGARVLTNQVITETNQLREKQSALLKLHQLDEQTQFQRTVFLKATANHRLVAIFEDIAAHLLPPSWLQRIHYENGQFRLYGFTSQPSTAAEQLASSELFSRVTLEEVNQTSSQQKNLSQFELSATSSQQREIP